MRRRIIRAVGDGWEGIEPAGYSPDTPGTGVARHTIVGESEKRRERAGTAHGVALLRSCTWGGIAPGKARARALRHRAPRPRICRSIGDTATEIGPDDIVYVGPLELHQFVNRGTTPFGFYCFVDTCRDFSQSPTPEELARLEASPAGVIAKPFAIPPPAKR